MTCTLCKERPAAEGYKRCAQCRKTWSAYMRRYRETHPQSEYMRQWHRRRRETVLAHYGGLCACCGEDQYEFLALDHTNGDGERHRAEVGQGSQMIDWVIKSGFPEDFRVLCHNCNQAIGYYGRCPHEAKLRLVAGDE